LGKRRFELAESDVIERWAKNYPKVMTWLAKVQLKSQYAWLLWLYCKFTGKTPDELLALKSDPRSREAEYLLDKFVAEKLPLTDHRKQMVTIAVKSFYKHNYSDLAHASGQVIVSTDRERPHRKHSKEELLKIYRSTQNPRDRALITFTWSTAIARESLTKVKWKHLEPDWEKKEIPHIHLPSEIIKGHGIGKYKGVEQHTFLTPEAKRDLIEYRDWLQKVKGLKLTPEDNVFIAVDRPFNPLTVDGLINVNVKLVERSGVAFGWHDARRYVETALEEVKIHPNWARKIRGRKVKGEENPYSRPNIEQLRQAYKEAVPLLEFTQPTQLMELKRRQEVVEEIQSKIFAGEPLTDQDRENIRLHQIRLTYKPGKIKYNPKRRQLEHKETNDCTDGVHCGEEYTQIKEIDLLGYLREGWEIVHKLASGEVIIKKQEN
jgi:hypothetical protein